MAESNPTQTEPNEEPKDAVSPVPKLEKEEDLDASLEEDLDMSGTATAPNNTDGAADSSDPTLQAQDDPNAAPEIDPRIPTKKDLTLRELLGKMDDYAPIIPDAVTNYYLTKAGLPPPPQTSPHLARLLALATQKFIADVAADAYQFSRMRTSNTTSNNPMGSLGAAAGFQGAGQIAPGGAAGATSGAAGGAAGPAGKDGQPPSKGGHVLGVQRAGFGGGGQGSSQGRTVLTMEDLGMAVGEYGVNVKRNEFYR
ncbi:MAG: TTAGGG repeat binding factor [Chaenotheca gracillima]|nr:MAG: TTAGGG repeat binding factor [Chaenotheca gracillima]